MMPAALPETDQRIDALIGVKDAARTYAGVQNVTATAVTYPHDCNPADLQRLLANQQAAAHTLQMAVRRAAGCGCTAADIADAVVAWHKAPEWLGVRGG